MQEALKGTGLIAEIENGTIVIKEIAREDEKKEMRTVSGVVSDVKKLPLLGYLIEWWKRKR